MERSGAWSRARLVICALALGALAPAATVLEAQESNPEGEGATAEGPRVGMLVGARADLLGLLSPGANLDVRVGFPGRPAWVSLQFLAQMIRWNVQNDSDTRRDHLYLVRGSVRNNCMMSTKSRTLVATSEGSQKAPDNR